MYLNVLSKKYDIITNHLKEAVILPLRPKTIVTSQQKFSEILSRRYNTAVLKSFLADGSIYSYLSDTCVSPLSPSSFSPHFS